MAKKNNTYKEYVGRKVTLLLKDGSKFEGIVRRADKETVRLSHYKGGHFQGLGSFKNNEISRVEDNFSKKFQRDVRRQCRWVCKQELMNGSKCYQKCVKKLQIVGFRPYWIAKSKRSPKKSKS